jgi:hypothetical protein
MDVQVIDEDLYQGVGCAVMGNLSSRGTAKRNLYICVLRNFWPAAEHDGVFLNPIALVINTLTAAL